MHIIISLSRADLLTHKHRFLPHIPARARASIVLCKSAHIILPETPSRALLTPREHVSSLKVSETKFSVRKRKVCGRARSCFGVERDMTLWIEALYRNWCSLAAQNKTQTTTQKKKIPGFYRKSEYRTWHMRAKVSINERSMRELVVSMFMTVPLLYSMEENMFLVMLGLCLIISMPWILLNFVFYATKEL